MAPARLVAGRRTNRALLILLPLAGVTGFACFLVESGPVSPVVITHGVVGLAVAALTPWKQVIVRRGWRRARPARWWSLLLALAVVVALATGLLHSTGLLVRAFGLRAMQVHVGAALVVIVPLLLHVRGRVRDGVRGLRHAEVRRRDLLGAGALLFGAGAGYAALTGVARVAGWPGAHRRPTGSYPIAAAADVPATIWLFDRVPDGDLARWTLTVAAGDFRRDWRLAQLPTGLDGQSGPDAVETVLDCTSGWWTSQTWTGVRVARLLPPGTTGSVKVTSATGYSRRLPLTDDLLLATHVGGRPLDIGHGAPLRLVVPGRRGFHWVKWVVRVEHDPHRPWWVELPLPPR